ncbi:MAG: peptidoglycan DD-metalloendopeptidase family protein [Pseudomonadota bacterium]|nr:peptidoglycan DD-metalloendopeptidase family protein [Pseudomonadota bacterium]
MNHTSIFKWASILPVFVLAACVSQRPAPVVDRSGRGATSVPLPALADAPPSKREAKDGIYIAQRGDTLQNVAQYFGIESRELARLSNIAEESVLRPGQTLQVAPPSEVATVSPITRSGQAEARPLPPSAGSSLPALPTPTPSLPPPAVVPPSDVPPASSVAPPLPATPAEAPRVSSGVVPWQWPTAGKVIETFDDPRNKGIDIGGIEGASVQAAADGEVVYVGSAVRGYGNLVIVRHSEEFITAYAHNRKVLVAEKQSVKRGQTIAELGRSDADRPKLHFEIRHQGKPVDPLKYLPAR